MGLTEIQGETDNDPTFLCVTSCLYTPTILHTLNFAVVRNAFQNDSIHDKNKI